MFSASLLLPALTAAAVAYLLGSLSTAIIVCRLMGLPDPRTAGSNNPGTTNVLRIGGRLPAALTLLGDGLKGYLPVLLTSLFLPHPPTVALVALAAFLGHVYPIFFEFRGGKGVATAFGALLGISGSMGALALLTWLAVSLTFRRSSLAALVTFLLIPVYLLVDGETVYSLAFVIIGLFVFWTHRSNISRLVSGDEPIIGKR
ncbi:MAG: glycerol-3-phosphate 1-O-acyltransferase PlsY [Granulosicoccus sp.]